MTHHHHRLTLCYLGKFSGGHTLRPFKPSRGAILKAANEDSQLMILFAVSTELRAGDQWALRWAEISNRDLVDSTCSYCSRLNGCGSRLIHPTHFQHTAQAIWIVSNDPIDVHFNKCFHAFFFVDRPDLDGKVEIMGLFDLGGVYFAMIR